jgi:hypothetical protein
MPQCGRNTPASLRHRPVSHQSVIHLTQVTPICSVRARAGVPAESGRIRGAVRDRGGLSRLSSAAALARWLPLSAVWKHEGMAGADAPPPVHDLRSTDLDHRGHDFPGHAQTADGLVPSDVGRHRVEGRHERARPSAPPRPAQLPNRYLDEFTFRFNRRRSRSRGLLFFRRAQQAVQVDRYRTARWSGRRVAARHVAASAVVVTRHHKM